ncbi:hypothetical protein Btru_076748 [Bulinus truncatus]|nr:hypothetical protein Btru_076748 [Bulinus truncatus]
MKIPLEVLASTPIKRKKPWSQILWLGKELKSLFLLDGNRVSLLYLPSGRTKKTIHKLSALLPEAVYITSTTDGLHLLGLQSSGEVFIWHRDSDELKTVYGLSGLLLSEGISLRGSCKLFSSADCNQLLLIVDYTNIFLWSQHQTNSKNHTVSGKWMKVTNPSNINLPIAESKEASIDALFLNNEMFGKCCQLSFIFTQNKCLQMTSLLIRFDKKILSTIEKEDAETSVSFAWSSLDLSLKTCPKDFEAINMQGAYVCRYTHDGQILAVGINQKSPADTSVLYISPFLQSMLITDIKGAGVKDPALKRGRQYWIADLKWTSDNLFLAVILHNGSAGLLSRLGEPLILISKGCSVNLGPAYFLPFTPLISIQSDESTHKRNQDSLISEFNIYHQKFSVSTHPSEPIVLFSDGYIVTVIQLPAEYGQMIFMRDLVLQSSLHLRLIAETNRLDLTLANAYNMPAGELENIKHSAAQKARQSKSRSYPFEEASLNETLDSEISLALGLEESAFQSAYDVNSGKIVFGEAEALPLIEEGSHGEARDTLKALQLAKQNLFNVWKLAASSTEPWSANLDKVVNHAVHNTVKLFSLILDCPQVRNLLEEALGQNTSSLQVNTQSLFKVVSMYKLLMDILKFDCLQRHLLPSVIQLSHRLLSTILSSTGLDLSDPRIKTLTGCFTLLKFTEKTIQNTYIVLPRNLKSKGLASAFEGAEPINLVADKEMFQFDTDISKRMTSTWKLLFKAVTQFLSSDDASSQDLRQAHTLKNAIQQTLGEVDSDIDPISMPEVSSGERFSMDGRHTMAILAWQKQLKKNPEAKSVKGVSRLLHSLLYTYILRNDLLSAVSFVDSLIGEANLNLDRNWNPDVEDLNQKIQPSLMTFVTDKLRSQAFHKLDMIPCISDKAVRQIVQSLARFMAAYFCNQTVLIFPPHNPAPLPAVHFETSIANSRIIPKYHEDIAAVIRHQKLSAVWTVERTLEYLLLSGLVCEAVWFADRMGDWKSAYQLSVAHVIHKRIASPLYIKVNKPLSLPDWLSPDAVLRRNLEKLVKHADIECQGENSDSSNLTHIIERISIAGLMGYSEVGNWLLQQLVSKLKIVVKLFPPLVTKEFYLPSPPIFCPQPSRTEKQFSMEASDENKLRQRASSVIQLTLCVLNATHLSVPLIGWYVKELLEVQKKATQFKANTEGPCINLPDVLLQYLNNVSEIYSVIEDSSVLSVMSYFRDFCSILWLLHVRDQLSLQLRIRERHLSLGLDVENNEQWLRECFTALQWAVNLVPYSHYLSDEASVYKVILALLQDLPATEDTANILAEHLYDRENLHPEVQERLERLMAAWQSIILQPASDGKSVGDRLIMDADMKKSVTFLASSPRGLSLSAYFYKQCLVMEKVFKKKRQCFGNYEEFVFNESNPEKLTVNVGSRPFETKKSYIYFLETFFDVSFTKFMESMNEKDQVSRLPLLHVFAEDIISHEMKIFSQRAPIQTKSLSITTGVFQVLNRAQGEGRLRPRSSSLPRTRNHQQMIKDTDKSRRSKRQTPVGLFRGQSMTELPTDRIQALAVRAESEPNLDDMNFSYFVGSRADSSHQNISSMASRYGMSRENVQPGSSRDEDQSNWSLAVNFGKKYTTLQQLVEWFDVWGRESLAVGSTGEHEILDIPARMRIHIPSQLIILSLWLLEYKYTGGRQEVAKGNKQLTRRSQSARSSKSYLGRHSPKNNYNLRSPLQESVRSPVTENAVQPSKPVAIKEQLPHSSEDSHHTAEEPKVEVLEEQIINQSREYVQSQSTLDHEEIISAYTHALDGKDDSSSIEVSSLASNELEESLRDTLNLLRRSTLNKTIFPPLDIPQKAKTDETKTTRAVNILPSKNEQILLKDPSAPEKEINSSRSGKTNLLHANQQTDDVIIKEISAPDQVDAQHVGGLTDHLQNVIRSEFRRILEAQQKSVLAMMGAVDGIDHYQVVPSSSSSNTEVKRGPDQNKINSSEKPEQQSVLQTQHVMPQNKETKPNTSLKLLNAEDGVNSPPYKPVQTRHMREALQELQNLQTEVQKWPGQNYSVEKMKIEESPSKEEMFQFPLLSFQAWSEQQQLPPSAGLDMLLLHLNKSSETQKPFKFLAHYLPQIQQKLHPRPQPPSTLQSTQNFQAPPQYLKIAPSPTSVNPLLFAHPPPSYQTSIPPPQPVSFPPPQPVSFPPPQPVSYPPPQPVNFPPQQSNWSQHFPPLHVSTTPPLQSANHIYTPPAYLPVIQNSILPQNFPLLKLIPSASERNVTQQETKQRLLQQFHQHVLNNNENSKDIIPDQNLGAVHMSKEPEKTTTSENVQTQSSPVVQTSENANVGQESADDKVDASTSDTHINPGFALPRGLFESYLQLGEHLIGPESHQTNAAFQLRMAMAMQRQIEKQIKTRVDFSTMTQEQVERAMATDPAMEVVRTAEAATSITKDTGVDPIQEAIDEYNLKLHNNVLPPDIFMGLRFADQNLKSNEHGKGRSFLNVVDIAAASVLRDIPEQSNVTQSQNVIDSALITTSQTAEQMGAIENSLREKFQSRYSVVSPRTHDELNVRMFTDFPKENVTSVSIIPHSGVTDHKSSLLRHLNDMSSQMKAIDEMSQNIEREFKSSHLLLSTIQDVNASLQRSRSPSPEKIKFKPAAAEDQFFNRVQEKKSSTSIPSPQVSARSGVSRTSVLTSSVHGSHGELTELIQEVLAQGGDLSSRFSEELVQQLEKDTREKLQNEYHTSTNKLSNIRTLNENIQKKTPEEREKLKKWMTEKFHQRQEEYKKRRNELIEREPRPFKSQSTITKLNLKTLEENLHEKRKSMVSEFMEKRLIDAEHLMGSILVDKPDIPWTLDFQPKKRKVGSTTWKSPTRKIDRSPLWSHDIDLSTPSQAVNSRPSKDSTPMKGILKTSGKEVQPSSTDLYIDNPALSSITEVDHSMDSSLEIINYAKNVLEMDNKELESTAASFNEPTPAKSPVHVVTSQTSARKSFFNMVRLQRPETTRKWSELNKKRHLQDEQKKMNALQEAAKKSSGPTGRPNGLGPKQASGNISRQVIPRRVKTYSERLQEMKPRNKLSTTHTIQERGATSGPRTAMSSLPQSSQTSIQTRTFLRSHGPLHKPKTYAEQLQKLRPHPHYMVGQKKLSPQQSKSQIAVSSPASRRTRPYSNPYSDVDYEELASVLSDWDMDENLRNILYGGSLDSESQVNHFLDETDISRSGGDLRNIYSESRSDYFDEVMRDRRPMSLAESEELGAGDYQQSVDIEQIVEAASVASASLVSVIDWDAVEELIREFSTLKLILLKYKI